MDIEARAREIFEVAQSIEEETAIAKITAFGRACYWAGDKEGYARGFEAGIREYAWWKDGVQYVGSCGTTLKQAIHRLTAEGGVGR